MADMYFKYSDENHLLLGVQSKEVNREKVGYF